MTIFQYNNHEFAKINALSGADPGFGGGGTNGFESLQSAGMYRYISKAIFYYNIVYLKPPYNIVIKESYLKKIEWASTRCTL